MGLLERVRDVRADRRRTGGFVPDTEWPFLPFFGAGRSTDGRERPQVVDFTAATEWVMKRSGPVAALMFVRQLVFSEARFQWRQLRSGRPGELFGNTDLAVLEQPWPNATTGDLLSRMIQDVDLAGNAFVTIVHDHNGPRLKRLRPDWVTIVTGSRSEPSLYGDAIDGELVGYIYDPLVGSGGDGEVLTPDQVAHFAPLPDPEYSFRGMSWLTPVIREIWADSAATEHKLNFFRHGATPQMVVKVDSSVKPENFERFKTLMEQTHSGTHNAYRTLYLGGGADATVVGTDLRQLDFKATQGAGESRLAAAAGVPPVIVGFSEGLQGSSLNAGNYTSSRRRFADATLRPLWRNAAGSLASLVNVPPGAELWYDDRDIAFLREDSEQVAQIQQQQAITVRQYVDAGFEPKSVIAAVQGNDLSLLTHTGLYSVQLQKPGEPGEPKLPGSPQAPALPAGKAQQNGQAPGGQ